MAGCWGWGGGRGDSLLRSAGLGDEGALWSLVGEVSLPLVSQVEGKVPWS